LTAITASTLTTVAVFLPVVFVGGIAGTLFRDLALTVTFALLSSLLIAVTFLSLGISYLQYLGLDGILGTMSAAP
nr:efflux RND transporter permease subunit [Candidatus Sigynarchaeota archaeon]